MNLKNPLFKFAATLTRAQATCLVSEKDFQQHFAADATGARVIGAIAPEPERCLYCAAALSGNCEIRDEHYPYCSAECTARAIAEGA
jgi:hypothetical protein